jgi:hypothetical protein
MCQSAAQPAVSSPVGGVPRSAAQAVALVRNGLDWLAAADATALTGGERGEVLRALAAAQSVQLAATSRILLAWERRADRSPAEAADDGPVARPLRDLSTIWYRLLGAFGWFG